MAAAVASGGGFALAASSHAVRVCESKATGALTLRRGKRCGKHETGLSFGAQGPQGGTGPTGPRGQVGPSGPPGVQYVWSAFTYSQQERPQADGHVATFTFSSPAAGFALVSANFQVRIHNEAGNDCHVETQLASAPAVIGDIQPGSGSAGFIDQWVNPGLDTVDGGSTYLGFNGSASRVLPVVAGQNTVYVNGQYNNYPAGSGHDCTDALWGPVSSAPCSPTSPKRPRHRHLPTQRFPAELSGSAFVSLE